MQVDPQDAREIALYILDAAEVAEQDAFMFEFVQKEFNRTDEAAGGILNTANLSRNRGRRGSFGRWLAR